MLLGLVVCVIYIMSTLGLSFTETLTSLGDKGYTKIFNTDLNSPGFFVKQIIGGAFITIAMTGLDQEMMQKNISVRTLKDSQKNMVSFSFVIVLVNFLFYFWAACFICLQPKMVLQQLAMIFFLLLPYNTCRS